MARMRISTTNEQEAFDKPPLFDHVGRKRFLNLPKGLIDIATGLRTPNSQIGFLLMCGYFKATKRFYQPQDFHERDISFATRQLNLTEEAFQATLYTETIRLRHQRQLLEFYGFAPYDENAKSNLANEIATMAHMHLTPRLIFDRCMYFLFQHRIAAPRSCSLTDRIRADLHDRKVELIGLMDDQLSHNIRHLLDDLFAAPEDKKSLPADPSQKAVRINQTDQDQGSGWGL